MLEDSALEQLAEKYAGRRLREIRGSTTRVVFGELIGLEENAIARIETATSKVRLGRLAIIASRLNVPLSTFILPDDELCQVGDHSGSQQNCMEARA